MVYPDGVPEQRRGKGHYLFPFIFFDRQTNYFSETAGHLSVKISYVVARGVC